MTGRPDGITAPPPGKPPHRVERIKAMVAWVTLAAPILFVVVLDAAALAMALLDPSTTCWASGGVEGRVFPFQVPLLVFFSTMSGWLPVILLLAVMFIYLDWLRLRQLAILVAVYAAVLIAVGVENAWMRDLYLLRHAAACAG